MARTEVKVSFVRKTETLAVSEIEYFQADSKYVMACDKDGASRFLSGGVEDSLVALEKEFADEFIRIHRSTIMRKSSISRIYREHGTTNHLLKTFSGMSLPVSRRNVSIIRALIKEQEPQRSKQVLDELAREGFLEKVEIPCATIT